MSNEQQLADALSRALQAEARLAELDSQNANRSEARVDDYRTPKIPPFFRADPTLWFLQTEISLRNARITSESTKADVILAALDIEIVSSVRDIITADPPYPDIYTRIKSRIISNFAASDVVTLRQLLKGQVINDGKPSLMLSRLRNLNAGRCKDDVLKELFLEQMPSLYRGILGRSKSLDLDTLAADADDLADHMPVVGHMGPQICATGQEGPTGRQDCDIRELTTAVNTLVKKLDRLTSVLGRSRSRQRSKPPNSNSSAGVRDEPHLCHAHSRYPQDPRSCREWCDKWAEWKQKN